MRYKIIAGRYRVSAVGFGGHYSTWDSGKDDIDIPGNESADGIHPRMDLCRRPGEGSPDFLPL